LHARLTILHRRIIMARHDLPIGMRPIPGELLKQYSVYILTNRLRGVLYVGLSSSLEERIRQHREGLLPGFTKRYNLTRLVFYEHLDTAPLMIAREKRLKWWRRDWKIELIEKTRHPGSRAAGEAIRDLVARVEPLASRGPGSEATIFGW
jgi:putative endonuclease